jgi:hypothetical protein
MMDHPNIATVFDGGATETGWPNFMMELVKGVPITEHCDANKLSTHRELASFNPLSLVWFVAFSPDGNSLACAPGWGPLYLLRGPSLEEIDPCGKGLRAPSASG